MTTPKHWPTEITYITKSVYHASVPRNVVNLLRSSSTTTMPRELQAIPMAPAVEGSHRLTHIQRINDKEHPANGQLGLFASRKLAAETMLVFYVGEVHAQDRESDYDLSLLRIPLRRLEGEQSPGSSPQVPSSSRGSTSRRSPSVTEHQNLEIQIINLGVDASRMGNEARCVNDYRGIKQRPNAVFKLVRERNTGEVRMSVWTSRPIVKNEEILVSYGKAWWGARQVQDSLDG